MEERIGLEIGAGTERTCGKLIIFGLAVIAFATTHGSQRGVQFAPKRSDQIHHNINIAAGTGQLALADQPINQFGKC